MSHSFDGRGGATPNGQPGGRDHHHEAKNGFGTAALVLGILAILGSFIPVLGLLAIPLGLLGLVLGIIGFVRVRRHRANNLAAVVAGVALSIGSFVVAAVVTTATGAAIDSVDQAVNPTPTNAGQAARTGTVPTAPANEAKIGEALTYNSGGTTAKITVLSALDHAEALEDWDKPEAGKRFVAVEVLAENVGDRNYSNISWLGSKVYGESGQGYPDSSMSKYKDGPALPSSIDLKPGGKVQGWLMFEVPTTEKVASIEIDGGVWRP